MPPQKIVIIGGGFGGAAAARTVRALLGREHQVTLIDRTRQFYLCGSFPLLIVGERQEQSISRSLDTLERQGVRVINAEVRALDTGARTVTTTFGTLEYDHLVLAAGAVYDWNAVPGAATAFSFYDLASAQRLRDALRSFSKGRIIIAVAGTPYKCPPAPYETAMVLDWAFQRQGIRKDVDIHVFTPEPMPLAVAGPDAGRRLISDLESRGVHVHTGVTIKEVARDGREAAFSDGTAMYSELIVTVPVHRAPPLVSEAGLVGQSGWVHVRPETLETQAPGVYAIGDVTTVMMANGRPLPKAGVFASAQGETVGRNIAAAITGGQSEDFPGVGYCFILYGGDSAGMVRGEFLASGKPNVTLQPPTPEGFQAKHQFEEDWRSFRI